MADLYPVLDPYRQGMLPVDDLHTLYWEESGNPDGIPIIFLHGGPGAGASPSSRRFFDPEFYRIIIFDQRGSGRSTPLGEVRQNTTPLLISDMELLRRHLNVAQWVLFGGSWGSTLAFAYAQHHPNQCLGLILRGIFLCRKFEIDWFLYGMRVIFPEIWQEFSHYIPKEERHDLLQAYHRLLMNQDPDIYIPAAKMWSKYEGSCATLMPSPETVAAFLDETLAIGLARLEAHYFLNDIFLPENFLLENIDRIRHLPAIIIQGRYDIVCPMVTAQEVHEAWPEADYIIVPDAGHSAFDFALCQELVDACDRFKTILQ